MTDLQKEFEATGHTSWINSDLYPDGKIYTQEYTQWLELQVIVLREPLVSVRLKDRLFRLANDFALDRQGNVAGRLHRIHNELP